MEVHDDGGTERYCVLRSLDGLPGLQKQLAWVLPTSCRFLTAEALMLAVTTTTIATRAANTASFEDMLPEGLQASFCFTLETAMELLHYFLKTLAKSDRMTIRSDCTPKDFADYVAPCVSNDLLPNGGVKRLYGLHARASCLKPPRLAAYDRPVVVVSAFGGDALCTRADVHVVFGDAGYAIRQEQLLAHVNLYVNTVRKYLRRAFTFMLQACLHLEEGCTVVTNAQAARLARLTPRAVVEIRKQFFSRRLLPSEVLVSAESAWSRLGAVLCCELLKKPVLLHVCPREHGHGVGTLLSTYLQDKHVTRYLMPLRSDVYGFSGPFSAPRDVELFTTPSRCYELVAALYDVEVHQLDIEQYMACPDTAGTVCPTAVVARLMAANYALPAGVQTQTMVRLRLQRGKIMAGVETVSGYLKGLLPGLQCTKGVRLQNHFDASDLPLSPILSMALRDLVAACVSQDCPRDFSACGDVPVIDGVVDLFPAFLKTVTSSLAHEDVTKARPWVRPCFRDLPTLCDVDSTPACCVDRHEYHNSVLTLLGLDTICDCMDETWSEVPDVVTAVVGLDDAYFRAVFLCGRRLPTLSLHNLHDATPPRCAVMALLANVATRAALHAFDLVCEKGRESYGVCRNGHPCCLKTIFETVTDFSAPLDAVFTCPCGEPYDKDELLPFFTTSHATIYRARMQMQCLGAGTGAVSVCEICNTTKPRILDGGVSICSICSDVTCGTCFQHAHPGSLCSSFEDPSDSDESGVV